MAGNRDMVPSQGGTFKDLLAKIKLIGRLMADRRVPFWTKMLPIGALAYVVSPVDFIMGIPGLDAIDDVAVLWLGSTLFIELCPPDVVAELSQDLLGEGNETDSGDVIDGEVSDVTRDKQ
jgi:uncharacterized membrane protein YkvA (DUF1232 family)